MHSNRCVLFTESDGLAALWQYSAQAQTFQTKNSADEKGWYLKRKMKVKSNSHCGIFSPISDLWWLSVSSSEFACHRVPADDVSASYCRTHCDLVALDTCFLPGRGRRPDQSPTLEAEGHPAVWDSEGPTRHDGPRAQRRREDDLHSHADESNDW